jgi:hypothetical protein
MAHTKNLRVAGQGNGKQELPILRADGKEVGCIRGEGHLGDAHLFAAAPDMLEALLDLVCCPAFNGKMFETDKESHKAWSVARAAIAKAKGERR